MATGRLPDPNTAPVTAKGDLYTYSTVPAKLAVGNNGETLVADSSQSTGLRWQGSQAAGKNAIINGAMEIWQRGTSGFVGGSGATYSADRWNVYRAGVAGSTFSRQLTNDSTNLPFIQYALRAQRDSGNTSAVSIWAYQSIETVNSIPFAGRTVTVSFYARAGANYSAASSALNVSLYTGTGTDQPLSAGYTGSATPINTNVTLTTTWQRFSASGTLGSNVTEISVAFVSTPVGTAGANDWFEVTGVQLELGSVATPFTRAGGTLAGELAACQRYYVRFSNSGSNYPFFGQVQALSTTSFYGNMTLPVPMRVTPTSIEIKAASAYGLQRGSARTTVSTLSLDTATIFASGNLQVPLTGTVSSGLTDGNQYFLVGNFDNTAYLGVNAEL